MAEKFILENDHIKLSVSELGAEMKSLYSKNWKREVLWSSQTPSEQAIWKRSAPVLFPIVGALKNDEYILKEKKYHMPQHGFARDDHFICIKHDLENAHACFKLVATQETFKLYPFCFELFIEYKLVGNKVRCTHLVKNVDRQDMYFSIGAHPAFIIDDVNQWSIVFEELEDGFYQLEGRLVDWKTMKNLQARELKITPELFSKDALIFKHCHSQFVDLINHQNDQTIRLHGIDTPYFGLWGKGEVPFVCLEPWYGVSDSEDHDFQLETKNGIHILPMNESFEFVYEIEVVV